MNTGTMVQCGKYWLNMRHVVVVEVDDEDRVYNVVLANPRVGEYGPSHEISLVEAEVRPLLDALHQLRVETSLESRRRTDNNLHGALARGRG